MGVPPQRGDAPLSQFGRCYGQACRRRRPQQERTFFRSSHRQTAGEFTTRRLVDSSPVIAGKTVFVGASDGRLYALDLETGKEQWSYEAGGSFIGSPAVAHGRLVIANDDGIVFCFKSSKD